jgi:hypothetical protein
MLAEAKAAAEADALGGKGGAGKAAAAAAAAGDRPATAAAAAGGSDPRLRSAPRQELNVRYGPSVKVSGCCCSACVLQRQAPTPQGLVTGHTRVPVLGEKRPAFSACTPSTPPASLRLANLRSFRPGTSTWNTDEPGAKGTAPGGPGAPGGKKEDLSAGRRVPPPYSIQTEEGSTTTGAGGVLSVCLYMPACMSAHVGPGVHLCARQRRSTDPPVPPHSLPTDTPAPPHPLRIGRTCLPACRRCLPCLHQYRHGPRHQE